MAKNLAVFGTRLKMDDDMEAEVIHSARGNAVYLGPVTCDIVPPCHIIYSSAEVFVNSSHVVLCVTSLSGVIKADIHFTLALV